MMGAGENRQIRLQKGRSTLTLIKAYIKSTKYPLVSIYLSEITLSKSDDSRDFSRVADYVWEISIKVAIKWPLKIMNKVEIMRCSPRKGSTRLYIPYVP